LIFLLFVSTAGAVYVFLHARRFLRNVKIVSATMDGPVREDRQRNDGRAGA